MEDKYLSLLHFPSPAGRSKMLSKLYRFVMTFPFARAYTAVLSRVDEDTSATPYTTQHGVGEGSYGLEKGGEESQETDDLSGRGRSLAGAAKDMLERQRRDYASEGTTQGS